MTDADGMTVGIDIGGTKTLAIGIDDRGEVLGRVRLASGYGAEHVLSAAVEAAGRLGAELPGRTIRRVGIGIPGTVDHESGEVQQALNLGLEHVALGSALASRLGVPVHVENDVNAAALGALSLRSSREGGAPALRSLSEGAARVEGPAASIAYLNLGTGLAVGLVLDGRLWRGVSGAAGEIGHVPLDPDGPECVCGLRGCLEVLASGSGIARQWGEGVPTARELGELAAAGDERASAIFDRLVWGVASAIRLIVLAQDVERIVLGGGLADALGERLVEPVVRTLGGWEAASPFLASVGPSARVVLAPPDAPLAAVGAALAALDAASGADASGPRPLSEAGARVEGGRHG